MAGLQQSHALLPPEDEYPPILFRVTSRAMTFRSVHTRQPPFISPHHLVPRNENDALGYLFQTQQEFVEVITNHLTAQHQTPAHWGPIQLFETPFVSATSSFRYAVATAETHLWHGEKKADKAIRQGRIRPPAEVTITVIDTSLLSNRGPIWDAQKLSNSLGIRLSGKQNSAKDEFLIFHQIGLGRAFTCLDYKELRKSLRSFVPEVIDQTARRKRRFSDTWTDLAPKPYPDTSEAQAAFAAAEQLSAPSHRLRVPLMIQMLCLNNRNSWGQGFIDAVLHLVSEELWNNNLSGLDAIYTRVCTTYQAAHQSTTKRDVPIFDFSNEQMGRESGSATCATEVKYFRKCMQQLGPLLQSKQSQTVGSLWNLSVVCVLVRRFTKGVVDVAVKSRDREDWDTVKQLIMDGNDISDLTQAYMLLRQTVEGEMVWPLARLYLLLKDSPIETASSVTFWTLRFVQLARELSVARPNKRKLEALGTYAPAVKRPRIIHPVKQRTSTVNQVNYTMRKVTTPLEEQATQVRADNESQPPKAGSTTPVVLDPENAAPPKPSIASKATPGAFEGPTNLAKVDSSQALVEARTTSVPIVLEEMNSGKNDNNVGDTTVGSNSAPQPRPRNELATKVEPVPTNEHPLAVSGQETKMITEEAAPTVLRPDPERADTKHPLAESGQETKEIIKEASPAPTASRPEPEQANTISSEDPPTSVEILQVSESESAQERAMDEAQTTHTPNTVLGQDSIHDGNEVTTSTNRPNTILSHHLAHLGIPGAVIAPIEMLEDIIEVLRKP